MSDTRTQAIVLLYWGMLAGGAALSGFGLCRRLARYCEWRQAGGNDGEEIVFGDGRLRAGQAVTLAIGERLHETDPSGTAFGHIELIDRKYCVIALDFGNPGPQLEGNRIQPKCSNSKLPDCSSDRLPA